MNVFTRSAVMLWLAMLAMLAVVAVTAVPALAQGKQEETVDVNFELTIDGEVPEGQSVSLGLPGTADIGAGFCSPASDPSLPLCEDGGTYTASFISIGGEAGPQTSTGPFTIPAGQPLSYEYTVYAADGSLVETLESETITATEDTTVNVTYSPESGEAPAPNPGDGQTPGPGNDGEPGPGDQYENPPAPDGQYENGDPSTPDGQYENDDPSTPDGQSVTPGQPAPSADSGDGQGPSIAILPDTGGISLAAGLLGALMIGGGLIARRLMG